MGLRDDARKQFDRGGSGGLQRWCEAGEGAHGKAHRFNAAARYCAERRAHADNDPDRAKFGALRKTFAGERDKWERRYERRHDAKLPDKIHFAELLYHDPPHCHVAIADREVLEQVADWLISQGIGVSEFPYIEDVEPVHVNGSWHYRIKLADGSIVALTPSDSRLKKDGPGGLALDANDLDGGSDEEYAAFLELRSRAV